MLVTMDMSGLGIGAIIGLVEVLIIMMLIGMPQAKQIKKWLEKRWYSLFHLKELFKSTPLYSSIVEDRNRSKKY